MALDMHPFQIRYERCRLLLNMLKARGKIWRRLHFSTHAVLKLYEETKAKLSQEITDSWTLRVTESDFTVMLHN